MYKIANIGIPKYLTDLILKHEIGYNTRNGKKPFYNCRTESFKNSFFPYNIEAWFSLDPTIINSKSLEVIKGKLLAFIRPVQRLIYSVFNPQGLKFLTRLHLRLSHINPLCFYSLEVENTLSFFCTANIIQLFTQAL